MPPLNYTYEWLPDGEFDKHVLPADQAEGLRSLVRSKESQRLDDLITIALTKGKRHARFALEVVAAERDEQTLERETHALKMEQLARDREARRDRELKRLQFLVVILSGVAALAAVAQVIVAIVNKSS